MTGARAGGEHRSRRAEQLRPLAWQKRGRKGWLLRKAVGRTPKRKSKEEERKRKKQKGKGKGRSRAKIQGKDKTKPNLGQDK